MNVTDLSPRASENERCGLILDDGEFVEVKNIALDPQEGFDMDPVEALDWLNSGRVVGTWHTHPTTSAILSGDDYKCFLMWPNLKHTIIGCATDGSTEVRNYRVDRGIVLPCD